MLMATLEEFAAHLLTEVWPMADTFFEPQSLRGPRAAHPTLMTADWVAVLLHRGMRHENHAVQRVVLDAVISGPLFHSRAELASNRLIFDHGLLTACTAGWLYRGMHCSNNAVAPHEASLHAFLLATLADREARGGRAAASAFLVLYAEWLGRLPYQVNLISRDARLCLLRFLPKVSAGLVDHAGHEAGVNAMRAIMTDQLHFENSDWGRQAIMLSTLGAACRCFSCAPAPDADGATAYWCVVWGAGTCNYRPI
jgi:hypothetical protein